MKVSQRQLDKFVAHLAHWRGARAWINSYRDDHDRLIIALENRAGEPSSIGICFAYCTFLSGPVRWSNCNLVCKLIDIADGEVGFEISDVDSGFHLRCDGPITVGDGELTIPSN